VTTDVAPVVMFVCVHNAGRSQMAAALLDQLAGGRVDVRSAGTDPAEAINPAVVEVMAELGIDLAGRTPRRLTNESAAETDVVVTMGCGDTCPVFPGKRYLDWPLDDPAGLPTARVREIRNDIERLVRKLLTELTDDLPDA
jgi:protein-tyrosine-phosphatase